MINLIKNQKYVEAESELTAVLTNIKVYKETLKAVSEFGNLNVEINNNDGLFDMYLVDDDYIAKGTIVSTSIALSLMNIKNGLTAEQYATFSACQKIVQENSVDDLSYEFLMQFQEYLTITTTVINNKGGIDFLFIVPFEDLDGLVECISKSETSAGDAFTYNKCCLLQSDRSSVKCNYSFSNIVDGKKLNAIKQGQLADITL